MKVDHLQRWYRIFRSDRCSSSVWLFLMLVIILSQKTILQSSAQLLASPISASEPCFITNTSGFSFKCKLVSIRTTWSTQQKQWGLYQNKVSSSLVAFQGPGHCVDSCKMVSWHWNFSKNLKSFLLFRTEITELDLINASLVIIFISLFL